MRWKLLSKRPLLALLISLLWMEGVFADDIAPAGPGYVDLFPSIVTNFGGPGRLRYFKVDISLRLVDEKSASNVERHAPYLRSELVALFSKQSEEALTTLEGKQNLQKEALKAVQAVLRDEEGEVLVKNLLFTNFVIQR